MGVDRPRIMPGFHQAWGLPCAVFGWHTEAIRHGEREQRSPPVSHHVADFPYGSSAEQTASNFSRHPQYSRRMRILDEDRITPGMCACDGKGVAGSRSASAACTARRSTKSLGIAHACVEEGSSGPDQPTGEAEGGGRRAHLDDHAMVRAYKRGRRLHCHLGSVIDRTGGGVRRAETSENNAGRSLVRQV